ncbi:MAG: DNA repair protein RecN [Prolixibacteraceae bacterium]|jgi:DNA repair protein RecN (Recombination protein N)|nr:DNA repair protein RecN [Prolixibacteraceae bacterium]
MLRRLQIRNYALIRELDVDFTSGLTIITGETGAGKSILIGALSLILGQRADTTVLKDKGNKCIVEGVFDVDGYGLEPLFLENDLDYDKQVIFRREIAANGKSRAFVNDTPVNLKTLQDIGLRLIDIHSQHQSLELGNRLFQLMVVDYYAGNSALLKAYQHKYKVYKALLAELTTAEETAQLMRQELDYFQFQLEQLSNANLQSGEQEKLEHELTLLTHADELKTAFLSVANLLREEDGNALVRVKESVNILNRILKFYPEAAGLIERVNSIYLEMSDIAAEVAYSSEKMEIDPGRIVYLSERLDQLYSLQQKHHVSGEEDLIKLRDDFELKVSSVFSNDESLLALKNSVNEKENELLELAEKLTKNRKSVTERMGQKVEEQLYQLGMLNSKFLVEISSGLPLTQWGRDEANFLFTANKNGELNEISKVASGGELSRLMLSIKALISKSKALPTILFDEIDSGISGETADKMGNILKEISLDMQVINITHLPQIAAKGDVHYLVYKEDTEQETITRLKLLSREDRVDEVAKMLSGEVITEAARLNAEELLK